MTDIFRIYVHLSGGHWIDVSTKQAIIYGAGQGYLDLMNEIPLPNVSYIIDSDKNKWGKEIELLNVIYKIQCPFLLETLNLENYYIIISSNKNEKAIKTSIEMFVSEKRILICNSQSLIFCYKSIEDLFYYDPWMKRKLLLTNMSFDVKNIISTFENKKNIFDNITINCFMPLRGGESKLSFLFGNEKDLWVFSIPGYHNGWEKIGIARDNVSNRKIRYELRKKIDVDQAITVYEDETGVLIQKYADDYIDFSKHEIRKNVLDKCRSLHQTNELINIQTDMIEHHYINLTEKVLKGVTHSTNIITKIKAKMQTVVELLRKLEFTPQICHSDLLCSNIVCYRGDLFFIDWEYMAIGDAMFDVCRLLFSMGMKRQWNDEMTYEKAIQSVYKILRRDLDIYYERECTDEEYLHAFLVMLIFECRELYEDALRNRIVDIEKAKNLMNRIECIGTL